MSVKRFGSRYGKKVRDRLKAVERLAKRKYKCPKCHNIQARRVSTGIFQCKKCSAKFTGKAYTISKPRTV